MGSIAFAHPGKLGDALYCLPLIKYICKRDHVTADFYTSSYCAPLKELFEYQEYIDTFHISETYVVDNFGCGAQPWHVPIPKKYDKEYQLGFRKTPDQMLHQFIAAEQDIHVALAIEYEFPILNIKLPEQFICIAPRTSSSFNQIFDNLPSRLLKEKQIDSVIIGSTGDYRGNGRNYTGRSFLETLYILSKSIGFIGLQSSQLVLANGMPIKRIAPHDGISWDMRHVIHYYLNYYPINPTTEEILEILCK